MIQPPNDIESEQAVLWCIIIDKDCIMELELIPDDFYDYKNKIIFESIQSVYRNWIPVDLITLKDNLEKDWNLEKVWWILYISELTEIVPTTSNFCSYQKIVKEKSWLREILRINNAVAKALADEASSEKIIGRLYSSLRLLENNTKTIDMPTIYENTLEYIEDIKKSDMVWLSFGKEFKFLDMITWWIRMWKVIRIWWWSNVWKTWLLYNFLINVLEFDDHITFFSLENDAEFTMKNLYWFKKWVNSLDKKIKDNDIDFVDEATWFYEKPNFYLDEDATSLNDIFRRTLKNKSKYIFIDYMQLVEVDEWASPLEKLKEYWKQIQRFAKKNWVTVFDLSQLSNDVVAWWVDWPNSTNFEWWAPLKNSCDVWIHLYSNTSKMKAKEVAVSFWDTTDFYKNYLQLKVSKNRLWPWAGTIKDYIINFTEWWKYVIDNWWI